MTEVYTIAGAPFGAVECPSGWTVTPNGNCGGPPPKYFQADAAALQRALNTKGAGLRVDGIIGPLTVNAVNRLLSKSLDIAAVAAQVGVLTAAVAAATGSAGGGGGFPLTPAGEATNSPWLWALLGFNLVTVGLGTYGMVTRGRDAGGNVIDLRAERRRRDSLRRRRRRAA
jgi:hypothetical protein